VRRGLGRGRTLIAGGAVLTILSMPLAWLKVGGIVLSARTSSGFEGAGVVSDWSLELFSDSPANNPIPATPDFGRPLRQFDYGTISDVILHIKYTARESAGVFKDSAIKHLRNYFVQVGATPSLRIFNLKQEFPTQWYRFSNPRYVKRKSASDTSM
jgi:hypothetical protein